MNVNSLNKWRILHQLLEGYGFEIKHTIDDYNHCYYSDTFEGRVEYDIDQDTCTIIDGDNSSLIELNDGNLNEITLSQYLIQYIGK